MSTAAYIFMKESNGNVTGILCNSDGYPNHTGKILANFYQDPNKVRGLISMQEIRFLDINLPVTAKIQQIKNEIQTQKLRFGVSPYMGEIQDTSKIGGNRLSECYSAYEYYSCAMGLEGMTYSYGDFDGSEKMDLQTKADLKQLMTYDDGEPFVYVYDETKRKWYMKKEHKLNELVPSEADKQVFLDRHKKDVNNYQKILKIFDISNITDVRSANLWLKYRCPFTSGLHVKTVNVRGQKVYTLEHVKYERGKAVPLKVQTPYTQLKDTNLQSLIRRLWEMPFVNM